MSPRQDRLLGLDSDNGSEFINNHPVWIGSPIDFIPEFVPFTRGGPVVGALVLDQLGRADAAANVSESIIPNDAEQGLVEAWMAERALLAGEPSTARDIAQRLIALGRGRPSRSHQPLAHQDTDNIDYPPCRRLTLLAAGAAEAA